MITVYAGTPGSGKTYHAVMDCIRHNGLLITNINISDLDYHYVPESGIQPFEILKLADDYYSKNDFREDGVFLVLDEAQLYFNSRAWNDKGRSDWIKLFTNSRHYGVKILLITQQIEMIDKQIRGCVEYQVDHRKLSRFGFWGWLLSLIFRNRLFVAVERFYGLKQKVGTSWFVTRKKYWQRYNSYIKY